MTPGHFEYHRPARIDEAVGLLAQFGDQGKILAGGHSLIPMMKLRMAEPAHLIDINGIDELKGIRAEDGIIVIGAGTTQAEVLASDLLAETCAILPEAAALIADPQVRNCGTIGGNCANGDPGNDCPAVMMALDARYTLRSADGEHGHAQQVAHVTLHVIALREAVGAEDPLADQRDLDRRVGDEELSGGVGDPGRLVEQRRLVGRARLAAAPAAVAAASRRLLRAAAYSSTGRWQTSARSTSV